jgi:thiol-disulfide isomerase/thioredoxin
MGMLKKLGIAAGSAAVVLIVWATVALRSGDSVPQPPPLFGSMRNFTPAASPGPAPQTPFYDRGGIPRTLADFRGKIVLVNFWATWCGPCVREMPSLVRLQQSLAGSDFTVLALSQDLKGWSVIDPFVKRHGLERLPVYLDRNMGFGHGQRVEGLPTTILYGRDGRALGRLAGIAEWDSKEAAALVRHYIDIGKPARR